MAIIFLAIRSVLAYFRAARDQVRLGGKKLPELGAGLGKGIASFKKGMKEPETEQLNEKTT